MSHVELKNVTKRFGGVTALNDVSFDVRDGEFFVLLGPDRRGQDDDAAHDRRAGEAGRRARCCSTART